MSSSYTSGQVVKIHRPNKDTHGWQGRYIGTENALPGSAYVSFQKKDRHNPPLERLYRRSAECDHRMIPFSQLILV